MPLLSRASVRGFFQNRSAVSEPGMPLSPAAVRRGLRLSTVEGALATVHVNITIGAFLTGFALLIGAKDFELGLLGALPFIGQLFQFLGAYLEERFGERRRLAVFTSITGRSLWAVIAALPFLTFLGAAQLPLFLVLVAVSQALLGIAVNVWTSWMTDLVPPRQRGRYFGTRNTIGSITTIIATWLAGHALDYYRPIDERIGYALIFGVAVVCAVSAALVLRQQPEPPVQRKQRLQITTLFSAPFRHRKFRSFSELAAGWALVTGVAAPFYNAYGLQTLQLSFATLALSAIVTSAVSMVTQPFIGRMQDRYGDKCVLLISIAGVVLLPWGWILSTPTFLLPYWLTAIFTGVFWPGINQGFLNLLMERAPVEGRGAYVASYGAVGGLGTFLGSLVGGAVAGALGTTLLHLGPVSFDHYSVLFLASSVGRLVMGLFFARRL